MTGISRRAVLRTAAASTTLLLPLRRLEAQSWPSRPVRILVGFPAGGGADSATRIVAERLSEILGQQVVVENRPGAGGNIAVDAAAHAPPDGYTMVLATGAPAMYRLLLGPLSYDPVADLAPVTMIGIYPNILAVSSNSRFRSVRDFLAEAKAAPGRVTFASRESGPPRTSRANC